MGLTTTLLGVAGGVKAVETASNIRSTNYQVHAQEEQNALNRDWQTAEAEKARQFNTSERLASQDWQRQMMDVQNAYSAPTAQASRLRAAGINPQVAFSGQGATSVSASSGSSQPASSPVPSPVGGLSPYGSQPVDLQIPNLINGVASMIQSTAAAKKANVETGYLESAIPDMLRGLKTDADLKQIAADMNRIDLAFKRFSLPANVQKAYNEASKSYWDALISKITTGKVENEIEVLKSQRDLNKALETLDTNQGKILALDIANYGRKLNSVLELQGAQANAANASAEESRANAAVLKEEKRIRSVLASIKEDTQVAEADALFRDLASKGAISDKQKADADAELRRLEKVIKSYDKSESKVVVDAAIENLMRILGLSTSVSVHN